MTIRLLIPADTPDVEVRVVKNGATETARVGIWGRAHIIDRVQGSRTGEIDNPVPGSIVQADGDIAIQAHKTQIPGIYTYTRPDGLIGALVVEVPHQRDGWGPGDYYMLERDTTGRIIVEPGRNHRKIYATMGAHGLTRAEVATDAGVSEATVTDGWLQGQAGYGTQAKPLMADVALSLWKSYQNAPNSAWLLLENGHDYAGLSLRPNSVSTGESALHPMYIGTWGAGAPAKNFTLANTSGWTAHVVAQGINDVDLSAVAGQNWMVTDAHNDNRGLEGNPSNHGQIFDGLTAYRCIVRNRVKDAPSNGVTWPRTGDHKQGSFIHGIFGVLMEQNVYDHNGWAPNFHPDLLWNNGQYGDPPDALSHNFYCQYATRDLGCFENVWARGSSVGVQHRGGAHALDNLYVENDIAMNDLGGNYEGRGPIGNWSLHMGNISTSIADKKSKASSGGRGGMDIQSRLPSLIDNLLCHRSNPTDPVEQSARPPYYAVKPPKRVGLLYDNTKHYRWDSFNHIPSLDPAVLDLVTIQRIAAELTGGPANSEMTIPAFLMHLFGLSQQQRKTLLDNMRRKFWDGFAIGLAKRLTATTLVFKADPRGEGFRWDSRLNWSTQDYPGTIAGDSADLFGNYVRYGRLTTAIANLRFGGGSLEVTSGVLKVTGHVDRGTVKVRQGGQYHTADSDGDFEARGGRLLFTGVATDFNLSASGDAEAIFGGNATVGAGRTLRIDGPNCLVGTDRTSGTATLTLAGTLDMRAMPSIRTGHGRLLFNGRFKEGWPLRGDLSGFTGTVDYSRCLSTSTTNGWRVFVRDLAGTPIINELMVSRSPGTGNGNADEKPMIPTVSVMEPATAMPKIAKFQSGRFGTTAPAGTFNVVLGGALHLHLHTLPAGTYTLIEAAAITGDFASIQYFGVGAGLTATVNKTATAVTVTLAAA